MTYTKKYLKEHGIGARIREARCSCGMTESELMHKLLFKYFLNIGDYAVSLFENCSMPMPEEYIQPFAEALLVHPCYLTNGPMEPESVGDDGLEDAFDEADWARKRKQAELGSIVREARNAAGMSRSEFAWRIDVNYNTLMNWELGRKGLSAESRRKICELLGVTKDVFSVPFILPGDEKSLTPVEEERQRFERMIRFRQSYVRKEVKDFLRHAGFSDADPELDINEVKKLIEKIGGNLDICIPYYTNWWDTTYTDRHLCAEYCYPDTCSSSFFPTALFKAGQVPCFFPWENDRDCDICKNCRKHGWQCPYMNLVDTQKCNILRESDRFVLLISDEANTKGNSHREVELIYRSDASPDAKYSYDTADGRVCFAGVINETADYSTEAKMPASPEKLLKYPYDEFYNDVRNFKVYGIRRYRALSFYEFKNAALLIRKKRKMENIYKGDAFKMR